MVGWLVTACRVAVFASRQIKNRATLAGNIVTASPISDMAPVLLALGAHLELSSQSEVRTVAVDGFFTGYRKTVLRDDEVVTRIFLPRPGPQARLRTFKVSKRRELDIAIGQALARGAASAEAVGAILDQRRRARKAPPAFDVLLSQDARDRDVDVTPHSLGSYDDALATMTTKEPSDDGA